jgi:hypothetical protein
MNRPVLIGAGWLVRYCILSPIEYSQYVKQYVEMLENLPVLIAAVTNIVAISLSVFVPWVRVNLQLVQGLFDLSIPIEIGLVKCFSKVS